MEIRRDTRTHIAAKKSFPKKILIGAGTAAVFIPLLLFTLHSYLSYQAIVTEVSKVAPSPTPTTRPTPTLPPSPHFAFTAQIAGIRNNTLAIYDSQTNFMTRTTIPLRATWAYRMSPDRKKVFIASPAGAANTGVVFTIYDLHGTKLYTSAPVLENGAIQVGLPSNTTPHDYFAWDESSQGVLYVASKPSGAQFRYISISDNTDTLLYEDAKTYSGDETILLGFNYQTKKITMADRTGHTNDAAVYVIDIANNTDILITHLLDDSPTISLWREISPDQSQVIGKLSNLVDKTNKTTTPALPFTLIPVDQPDQKIAILPNLDITEAEIPQAKTATVFFIDNTTAALYYPFVNNETTRYNIELLDTSTQKVTLGFGTDHLLDAGSPTENIPAESVVDVNNQDIAVTTRNVVRGGIPEKLPDNFFPIGFVSL